jgi:hypothetical protein
MTATRVIRLAVVVLSAGCADVSAPRAEPILEEGPLVAADRPSYSWRSDSALTWRITNPRGVHAFYYPGNHIRLQRHVKGRWIDIGLYAGFEAEPRRLRAGDTLSARVPLTDDVFPVSGWYRLHARLYRDSTLAMEWPIGNRVSPAVWIGP